MMGMLGALLVAFLIGFAMGGVASWQILTRAWDEVIKEAKPHIRAAMDAAKKGGA